MKTLGRLSIIFGVSWGLTTADAREGKWSDADFIYYASIIRSRPAEQGNITTQCALRSFQSLDETTKQELAKLNKMSADAVVYESCRRLVKGIAKGKITYKIFSEWWDAPATEILKIPDYR